MYWQTKGLAAFVVMSIKDMIGQNHNALFEPALATLIGAKDETVLKGKAVITYKEHSLVRSERRYFWPQRTQ